MAFCGERASGDGRRRHRQAITTCVSDVRKKGDPMWQSKDTSPKTRDASNWVPAKETHPTSMRLQYEIIGNGLYSPLPIRHRLVMDLSSPLLIGHCETTRISAIGNPTLSTSVVVPEGLPRANPVSAMPNSIQKNKTE
jgi:hypothetical protein